MYSSRLNWLLPLALGFATAPVHGDPVNWGVDVGGNGHFYEYIPGTFTWQQANIEARLRRHDGFNGYLATITSEAERAFGTIPLLL